MSTILRKRGVFRLQTSASSLFLQLPSTYRSFHASPRPQFVEQVIPVAYMFIEGVHSVTGLPWAFSLPLSAFVVRATVALPLTIYARISLQKVVELRPLITAWAYPVRKQMMEQQRVKGNTLTPARATQLYRKELAVKSVEIYRRWNCQPWKRYTQFLQIPVWLTVMEAIREMCGQQSGFMGMLFRTKIDGIAQVLPVIETFSTEGMLWFPDLMAADPEIILPFILSGTIYLNIAIGTGKSLETGWRKSLTRGLKVLALAIGPLTLHVPTAMLLYWIASSSFACIQNIILEKVMPLKPKTLALMILDDPTDGSWVRQVATTLQENNLQESPEEFVKRANSLPKNRQHRL